MELLLGQEVQDTVTGFKGIVIARTVWLNGCARVTLQPKVGKDGKHPEAVTFDEPQCKVIGKGVIAGPRDTGGPLPIRPLQHKGPTRR